MMVTMESAHAQPPQHERPVVGLHPMDESRRLSDYACIANERIVMHLLFTPVLANLYYVGGGGVGLLLVIVVVVLLLRR
jgi:hypothetical protein